MYSYCGHILFKPLMFKMLQACLLTQIIKKSLAFFFPEMKDLFKLGDAYCFLL